MRPYPSSSGTRNPQAIDSGSGIGGRPAVWRSVAETRRRTWRDGPRRSVAILKNERREVRRAGLMSPIPFMIYWNTRRIIRRYF